MKTEPLPLMVIVGPTAVGKTAAAVSLAERLNAEIINADSMQVYLGMDIGTAKPSADERQRVPFHLLDLVEPDEPFSVAEWKRRAQEAIAEVSSRGRRAILCGGTGMYVRALLDGWSLADTPSDLDLRERLRAEAERSGTQALYATLQAGDPVTASRLNPNDRVRIVRALEVYYLTGESISVFQARDRAASRSISAIRIGLTMPRQALYCRIEERVKVMIDMGFESEVNELLKRGFASTLAPMRSLGYREMIDYLQGESDLTTTLNRIVLNTCHFAKRQMTWFRADKLIHWIDVSLLSSIEVIQRLEVESHHNFQGVEQTGHQAIF